MAVVDDLGRSDAGPSQPSEDYGRQPPQDMAAEQSVLGGMLLSKDAIADVNEILRGTDFYRPAHEIIHDSIVDLYGRGEPADPVTVAAELQRRGELQKVGTETMGIVNAKNVQGLFDVGEKIDKVCENCHLEFWYPNEKAAAAAKESGAAKPSGLK